MAELVDALGSGPSASNGVEVRVLFWAPITSGQLPWQSGLKQKTPASAGFFCPSGFFVSPLPGYSENRKIPEAVHAQMAELVDALGSGPSAGNGVEVRVLFWAPIHQVATLFQSGLRRHARQKTPASAGFFLPAHFLSQRSCSHNKASVFVKPPASLCHSVHGASLAVKPFSPQSPLPAMTP